MREMEKLHLLRELIAAAKVGLPAGLTGLLRSSALPVGRAAGGSWWQRLQDGMPLSRAIAGLLPDVTRGEEAALEQAVAAGEGVPCLEEMVRRREAQLSLRRETSQISLYPVIVLVLVVAVTSLVTLRLLPALTPALAGIGGDRWPWATRLLLWAGGKWTVLLSMVVVLGAGLTICLSGRGGLLGDRLLLNLPVVGEAVRWQEGARILGVLGREGTISPDTVRSLAELVRNRAMRAAAVRAVDEVEQGESVAKALGKHGLLPKGMAAYLEWAGVCGMAAGACREMSDYCRQRHHSLCRSALACLEPAVILVAAVVVGVVALAVVQPLYALLGNWR
ncbi:MAG TPA: hypothetical protein GX513_08410 [Firmicutes bacterium]|nr:hypothetical protein [Bacillota bacterium]